MSEYLFLACPLEVVTNCSLEGIIIDQVGADLMTAVDQVSRVL